MTGGPPRQKKAPNSHRAAAKSATRFYAFPTAAQVAWLASLRHFELQQRLQERAGIGRRVALTRALQAPFGSIFWYLEQRIARLSDELERARP